jgi:carboxylesterase
MVKRIVKFAGKTAKKAKSILFADPSLLYKQERHLINKPFFFEGSNGKAVLLIHGWTSTPYELRRLGVYLNENGYTVSGILLSGHGTVPKDLESISWPTWIDDAKKEYEKLKSSHQKVFSVGTSIGGNITMMLAKEEVELDGIVLMATPYLIRKEAIVLFFAKILMLFKNKYRKKFYPPTFGVSTTITRLISYQSYPVKSALETFELIREARKNLEKIAQPCLLMQSTHDHVVEGSSMESIYNGIASRKKTKKYVHKAYHTFISDIKNEHVFRDILNFLNEN